MNQPILFILAYSSTSCGWTGRVLNSAAWVGALGWLICQWPTLLRCLSNKFPFDGNCFQFFCSHHSDNWHLLRDSWAGNETCGSLAVVCRGKPSRVVNTESFGLGKGRSEDTEVQNPEAVSCPLEAGSGIGPFWGGHPGSGAYLFRDHQTLLVFSRGERLEQEVENM